MVGLRLREARRERNLSLQDVARQASISAATLSRIENGKQGLDLELFLRLSTILGRNPADMVGSSAEGGSVDPLVSRLTALSPPERLEFWARLTEARRDQATQAQRKHVLHEEVEELLAQLDMLRSQVEAVRSRLRT